MSILTNSNILITGGTGTFGKAFVRRALEVGARRIVVFSRDELKQSEMEAAVADPRLRMMIGDVRDRERLERAMRGVQYVIHAAAMKQVPACELHPWEAEETNSVGSRNVALAAIHAGVERAVLLSSDKAAAPANHYGFTKASAERHFTSANVYAAGTRTRLLATRYGNVLGSRGSVVEVWNRQRANGSATITITHRDATRFWMSIHDAVWLVETALWHGRGGEIFIPRIGAAPLLTLAQAIAVGAEWREIGLRRGEKLHEILITEEESRYTHDCGDWFVVEPERTWEHLPPLDAPVVADGFRYASNLNAWQLDVAELREMLNREGTP